MSKPGVAVLREELSATHSEAKPNCALVAPHGGELTNHFFTEDNYALASAKQALTIPISVVLAADVEMLGIGAYSPLSGFMGRADYERVVTEMRLADGTVWPLPITLPISPALEKWIEAGDKIPLTYNNQSIAILTVSEKFKRDKEWEAGHVYGKVDLAHPGVAYLMRQPETLVAGPIQLLQKPNYGETVKNRLTPVQTRRLFKAKGWQKVVGFQTRNPIQAGHEYVFRHALELVDGLLLHPLVGATKNDDVRIDVRVQSYEAILSYYPPERVILDYFPTAMRFAGPREAVFHAICRQNYGCSHFIVGRDHAGVGNFYAPDAAIKIFDQFNEDDLKIKILTYAPTFYCPTCQSVVTSKTCGHPDQRYSTSASYIRKLIREGKKPPPELMRPEVSRVLLQAAGYEWSDSGLTGSQIAELLKIVSPEPEEISTGKSRFLNNYVDLEPAINGNGR